MRLALCSLSNYGRDIRRWTLTYVVRSLYRFGHRVKPLLIWATPYTVCRTCFRYALIKFLYVFVFCSAIYAAEPGTESMEFLRMPEGARQIAMGEAGAVSRDAMSLWWNPAGISWAESSEIALGHRGMYEGVSGQCFSAAVPVKGEIKNYGVIGAGLRVLDYGDVPGYNISGTASEGYEPGGKVISLGYGMNFLNGNMAAGLALKSLNENLGSASGSGMGTDIGLMYKVSGGDWSLGEPLYMGFSMQNIGASVNYESKAEAVVQMTRLGFGWGKDMGENRLETVVDYFAPSSGDGGMSLGFEWRMKKIFNIRFGYKMSPETDAGSGLRAGFGMDMLNFSFDYAYGGYGDLGASHTLGVGIKFGKVISLEGIGGGGMVSPAETFKRAMQYYKEGKYPEAVLEFNKVLDAEPTNEKAMEYMKKASGKIEK